jgi:hypothetical protein
MRAARLRQKPTENRRNTATLVPMPMPCFLAAPVQLSVDESLSIADVRPSGAQTSATAGSNSGRRVLLLCERGDQAVT